MHPLRKWRADHGVSLIEVGGLARLSPSTVSRIERGQIRPRPQTKLRIARALGCRVGDLFPPDPPRAGRTTTKGAA